MELASHRSKIDRNDINWYRSIAVAGIALAGAVGNAALDPRALTFLIAGGMLVLFVLLIKAVAPAKSLSWEDSDEDEIHRAPIDDEFESFDELAEFLDGKGAAYSSDGRVRIGDWVIQPHPQDASQVQYAHKRYKGNVAREANSDE